MAENTGTDLWLTLEDCKVRSRGRSVKTFRRDIADGKLTAYRVGRHIRIREADFEAYMAGRLVTDPRPASTPGKPVSILLEEAIEILRQYAPESLSESR